jgi:hypothetical protein
MASRDYEEFIVALNAHGVRYLIVGAHALAHHGHVRATKDLDIYLLPSRENAERVLAALHDFFGASDLGYTVDDFASPDWIVQLGVAPVRIDLLLKLTDRDEPDKLWERRIHGVLGETPAFYLSREDLIRAKEAANRPQDRADLRRLKRLDRHRGDDSG